MCGIKMQNPNKALILADGQFPVNSKILNLLLDKSYFLICTDGAISNLEKINIIPDVIVGDLDSISADQRVKYQDRIVHIAEQETNDLTKAVNYAKEHNIYDLTIIGATGYREDHTLGNISLLISFLQQKLNVKMLTDYGEFQAYKTPCNIQSQKGQQISIFCFDPKAKLSSQGLLYKLDNLQLPLMYVATLNEALDNSFSLSSDTADTYILIYKVFDKNKKAF